LFNIIKELQASGESEIEIMIELTKPRYYYGGSSETHTMEDEIRRIKQMIDSFKSSSGGSALVKAIVDKMGENATKEFIRQLIAKALDEKSISKSE